MELTAYMRTKIASIRYHLQNTTYSDQDVINLALDLLERQASNLAHLEAETEMANDDAG